MLEITSLLVEARTMTTYNAGYVVGKKSYKIIQNKNILLRKYFQVNRPTYLKIKSPELL